MVLVEVLKLLKSKKRWPKFSELDAAVYGSHNLRTAEDVLRRMPAGLVSGVPKGKRRIPDGQRISLTLAGVHATGDAADAVHLFLRLVRLAAQRQRVACLADGRATGRRVLLTASHVRQLLGDDRAAKELLPVIHALLTVEPWGWRSAGWSLWKGWTFEIDRSVRDFADVTDAATYWSLRDTGSDGGRSTAAQRKKRRSSVDFGAVWPVVGAVPGTAMLVSPGSTANQQPLRVVAAVTLMVTGMALVHWYRRGLRWRRRRWWSTLTAAVVALATMAWTFVPNTQAAGADQLDDEPTPPHGSCVDVDVAGVVCRYLRLAVGQRFDLDAWRADDGRSGDIELVDPDRLAPFNEGSISPAVPRPDGPLDPRACWTAGVWQPQPQVSAHGDRLCVRTAGNAYAAVVRMTTPPRAAYDARFLVAVATPQAVQDIPDGLPVVVDNRVTAGTSMREDSSAYLTELPRLCRRECALEQTDLHSGAKLTALCHTVGDEITNGHRGDPADDTNPHLYTSSLWYKIRWPDGRTGFLSEVWIRSADRGGLGLPLCR